MTMFLDLTGGKDDNPNLRRIVPGKVSHLFSQTGQSTEIHFAGGGWIECSFPLEVVQARIEAHLAKYRAEPPAQSGGPTHVMRDSGEPKAIPTNWVACVACGERWRVGTFGGRFVRMATLCETCLAEATELPQAIAHDGAVCRLCRRRVQPGDQWEALAVFGICIVCHTKNKLAEELASRD